MNRFVLVLPLVLMLNLLNAELQGKRNEYDLHKRYADSDEGRTYASGPASDRTGLTDQHDIRGKSTCYTHRSRCHDSFCPFADAWLYEDLPVGIYQEQYGYEEPERPKPLYEGEQPARPKQHYDQVHSSRPVFIQRQEQQDFVDRSLGGPAEAQIVSKAVFQAKRPTHFNGVFGFSQNPKLRICRPLFTPSARHEVNDIAEQTVSCFLENADVEIRRGTGWSLASAHLKDMHVVQWEFMPGLGMLRCSIDCIVTVKFGQEFKEPPSVIIGIEATDYDRRSSAAMPISEFDQAIVWVPDSLVVCPVEVATHGFKAKCTLSAQGYYDVRVVHEQNDIREADQFRSAKKADFRESLQWLFNNLIMSHSLSFALCGGI